MGRENYLAAVECGTSKTAVLIGASDGAGSLRVIGFGSESSGGAVFKGDIVDRDLAESNLNAAMAAAVDEAGIDCRDLSLYSILLSGSRVESGIFSGVADIPAGDRLISRADLELAADGAREELHDPERYLICSELCWHTVDGKKVISPLGMHGRRLVSSLHLIHAPKSDMDNFFHLFSNLSIESEYLLSFFPPLAETGLLTENEMRDGVLLIDLGAGTAEYVYYSDGVLTDSGVLPVGMKHVANDLAVGLGLNFAVAERILDQDLIRRCRQAGQTSLENSNVQLPLESLEIIAECRLKEIFQVIRDRIWKPPVQPRPELSVVLTGGGSAYLNIADLAGEIFGCDCRVATVPELEAMPEVLNSGRYTALCGALTNIAARKNFRPREQPLLNRFRDFFGGGNR